MGPLFKKFHPEGIPWPASVFYNRLSQTRIFRDHYRMVAEEVVRKAGQGPMRVLDIGTGPGFLLHALASRPSRADLIGMDISTAMVAQARKNLESTGFKNRITLCCGDAASLPFADRTVDCVVSTGALHHWKRPVSALNEIYRILKPGGMALIYDLVRRLPRPVRKEIRSRFGTFRLAMAWLHSFEEPFVNPEDMMALAARTRFRLRESRFTGGLCCLDLVKAPGPQA